MSPDTALHQPRHQIPVALLPQLEARVSAVGSVGARRHPHQLGVDASAARHIVVLLELDALLGVGHRLHVHHLRAKIAGAVLVEVEALLEVPARQHVVEATDQVAFPAFVHVDAVVEVFRW